MSTHLDLADIQGNILRSYGLQSFPKARYIFLHFADGSAEVRAFVEALRGRITTAARWDDDDSDAADIQARAAAALRARRPRMSSVVKSLGHADYPGQAALKKPAVAVNIAFTFYGLFRAGVPLRTLQGLPQEFIAGMAQRAAMLGDPAPESKTRDPVWRKNAGIPVVHAMVTLNAQMDAATGLAVAELEIETQKLQDLCTASGGAVAIVRGHGADGGGWWQDATATIARDKNSGLHAATGKEHFGFTDGFGDPVFEGQYPEEATKVRVFGHGKIEPGPEQKWAALATGEFLLGYPDEAQEIPGASMPLEFSRNGTFVAWRKLHQNIAHFEDHIDASSKDLDVVAGLGDESHAALLLRAKMAGRWSDGVPLSIAPTCEDWLAFNDKRKTALETKDTVALAKLTLQLFDFKYGDDLDGAKCPAGAHMRRVNPRDMLDPTIDLPGAVRNGSALTNRRRIIRRGLPYGAHARDNDSEHGVIFMAVCASLFRQFEFVQQQWIQYGLDFNAGNDTCPLLGNHDGGTSKFTIPVPGDSHRSPFLSGPLKQFVECRGGEYFFIPSMTALRMMGTGIVDPT